MRRRWLWILICAPVWAYGQPAHSIGGLLQFHPQFHYLYPSAVPEGRLHLGLPVVSRISVLANHRVSYKDVFLSERSFLDLLRPRNNSLGLEVGVGTFMLGYKTPGKHYGSFFINEKASFFLYYPKDLVSFLWRGNASVAGRTVELNALHTEAMIYRELGFSYSFPVNRRLRLGLQLKHLIGLASVHIPRNSKVNLDVDPDTFEHQLRFENWRIQWAGFSLDSTQAVGIPFDPMYLAFNDNRGYALGLGMSYRVAPLVDVHVSLRDLGFIRWKNHVSSYSLMDNELIIDGVEPDDRIKDLGTEFKEAIVLTKGGGHYTTVLHYSLLSTLVWRLTRDNYLSATLGLQRVPNQNLGYIRPYYSLNYMRQLWRRLSVSAFVMRYPQNFALGGAFSYQAGVFQFYGAVGNILGFFDVSNVHVADFNLGLNIVTGRWVRSRKKTLLCPALFQ